MIKMVLFGATKFDFNDLFVFELANNHGGDVEHGKRIIKEVGEVAREFGIRAALKLQLRDLDHFIHPEYRDRHDIKHIKRFLSTRLDQNAFRGLIDAARSARLITMATPFDEESVDLLLSLDIDVIKVASCSSHDWPLLEKIAPLGKPVIVSVGGHDISGIDKVVSFFDNRGTHYALMHCIGIYPTPTEKLRLNQIELMKRRYPHLVIGFSTHEPPKSTLPIALAYAKGARIFEKHVGIPLKEQPLNSYSATPDELRLWLASYKEAVAACGEQMYSAPDPAEKGDIESLFRGVFARREIAPGEPISREDVFFAMPYFPGTHLASGQFRSGVVAEKAYTVGEALSAVLAPVPGKKEIIYSAIHTVKGMLNNARVPLGHDFTVELSHHSGVEHFKDVGCIIIDCFNREYAKKIIVQLPGQTNPPHYHKKKDETFHMLDGELYVNIEGRERQLLPGDSLWVPRGVMHSFRTKSGAIFEEISTTSFNDDSYYSDTAIATIPREARKTVLLNWGRHQFD